MSELVRLTDDPLRNAARQVLTIAELFDILWEQDRNEAPLPRVSVSQLRVLTVVGRDDGVRMRDLTRLLGAARPSVSRLIDRLQALGFIERRPCPDSRREVSLSLTPAGRRHLEQLRERREDLLLKALGTIPAHQRLAMTEGLARMQAALDDQPKRRVATGASPPAPAHALRSNPH
ncbi:MarR family winged helix-turn-helix transcriptional regulator [Streptomyces sp. NPDC059759]|uniref:MarR family winged helix-turn-helix transcriptional regulator n=1 Tax=Streptomyces sp. NPDC059759 TaxID=3346936 RepID=UPI0036599D87